MKGAPVLHRYSALNRTLKNALKSGMRRLFEGGQRLGLDVLPRHFYSEIPDVQQLRQSDHWKRPFSMIGVEGADAEGQLAFVREVCTPELVERMRTGELHLRASEENGETGYGPIEADFLYAFVRSKRPRQIFQIGCGVSTALCLMAAEDAGYTPEIICVDPYPTATSSAWRRRGKSRSSSRRSNSSTSTGSARWATTSCSSWTRRTRSARPARSAESSSRCCPG